MLLDKMAILNKKKTGHVAKLENPFKKKFIAYSGYLNKKKEFSNKN